MDLERALASVAEQMLREFEVFSVQYQHRGLRGTAREDVLKEFLERYLPADLELASGALVDIEGNQSSESELVVVDRLKTPLLFARSKRLIPSEGALAVLEVKSKLDSTQLRDALTKCKLVKGLRKSAYFPQQGAVYYTVSAYGREYEYFPTMFSLFAYESIKYTTLMPRVKTFCEDNPGDKSIDGICCLDGWVACWCNTGTGTAMFDLTWSPGSQLVVVKAGRNALLFFYLMYTSRLSQHLSKPIRIADYAAKAKLGDVVWPVELLETQ
jgi:hypothetical protein